MTAQPSGDHDIRHLRNQTSVVLARNPHGEPSMRPKGARADLARIDRELTDLRAQVATLQDASASLVCGHAGSLAYR